MFTFLRKEKTTHETRQAVQEETGEAKKQLDTNMISLMDLMDETLSELGTPKLIEKQKQAE